MATVLQRVKDKRLTEAQECETRIVFELATEGAHRMNAKQLKMCLRAIGFDVAKGEPQALVYEFDYTDTATIDLADFRKIFLSKMLERSAREQFEQAFKATVHDGSEKLSLRTLSAALHKDHRANDDDSLHENEMIDGDLLRRQMRLQYYNDQDVEAIQGFLSQRTGLTNDLHLSRQALAAFLRL